MEITSIELKEKIKNGEKVIVDFWATFCGPCKMMKPIFETVGNQVKENGSTVQLYTMDIDNNRDFVIELGLRSVPTIKGFSNGKEVFSEVGAKPHAAILEMVNRLN